MQSMLRKLRNSQGLTLSYVANLVGIDPANLSRIERGRQVASLDVAERLVKFYSSQINELQILYPQRYANTTEHSIKAAPQKKEVNRG